MARWFTLIAGIALTGVLLVLCLPLGEIGCLGWVALAPLLTATRNRGFVIGFLAAILAVFFAAWLATTGVVYAQKHFEGNSNWLYTGFGLFGFAMSLTTAVWADANADAKPLWWFAALAVVFESLLLLELPAHLALSQYRNVLVLQIASIGGIWLVSFIIWLVNLWLARQTWLHLVSFGGGIAILLYLFSWLQLPGSKETATVAAIQTSATDEKTLLKLHTEASRSNPSFVVWPEFSGMEIGPDGDTSALVKIAREPGIAPFVTTFRDRHDPLPHNTAVLFSFWGESERYFKRKPFGAEKSMHAAGSTPQAVSFSHGLLGLNICFDSCFPDIMRQTAELGVIAIALPTIDPDSPHYFTAAMHAAYSPFRSAETGVPIIRADGNAYSSITDSHGQIVAELVGGDGILVGKVPANPSRPLNRYIGDGWMYFCWIVVLVGGFRFRNRKNAAVDPVEADS